MTPPVYSEPSRDEQFYARALTILAGPTRRTAVLMRTLNAVYWIVILSLIGWLLAQAIYRPVPISDRIQELRTPAVRAGDPVKVFYSFRRSKTCAADLFWTETDGSREVHRFGPVHVASPGEPGHDEFVYAWPTARTASPGQSRLRVVIEFQCPDNYLEAFYPTTEVLPELDYETLPGAVQPAVPGPP